MHESCQGSPIAANSQSPLSLLFATAELAKVKLTGMATLPAAFAWVAAGPAFEWRPLIGLILGVFLAASGAAALNQWSERRTDARMNRTVNRPLPSGRMDSNRVLGTGLLLVLTGVLLLAATTNIPAAGLALAAAAIYWLVYTPLKKRTHWCTEIGAVSGALPPLIGWAAATGTLSLFAWILVAVLFFWQMPHFHPIAWRHREDYRRAGLRMRAALENTGPGAANHSIAYTIILIALGAAAFLAGEIATLSLAAFLALGAGYLYFAIRFRFAPDPDHAARNLFRYSLVYLPALLAVITLERVLPAHF